MSTTFPNIPFWNELIIWFLAVYPILFTSIGFFLAYAFGKKTDGDLAFDDFIKEHGKFSGFTRWFLNKCLHFVHHYWIGALLAYVFNPIAPVADLPWFASELGFYFFFGIFLEDGIFHLNRFASHVVKAVETPTEQPPPP